MCAGAGEHGYHASENGGESQDGHKAEEESSPDHGHAPGISQGP